MLLRRIGVRMRRRAGDAAVEQQARLRRHLAQGWYCQVLDSFYAGRAAAALQAVVRRRAREEVMAARAAVWEERERGHKMLMQRRLEEGQAAVRDRENQTDCLAERDDRLRRFPTKNKYAPPTLRPGSAVREKTQDEQVQLAIKLGQYHKVEAALDDQLVSVHVKYGSHRRTLLHTAAAHGQRRIAKLLLRSSADINAVDADDVSPLQLARQFNHHDLGDYLREKGARAAVPLLPPPPPRTPAADPRPPPPSLLAASTLS